MSTGAGTVLNAEYVVVGAGITGASVAAQLAGRGADTVVLEAGERAATGATAASGGMVRGYDPDPVVARLAAASLSVYADPSAWYDGTSPLHRTGAVTLADRREEPRLRAAAAALRTGASPGARVVSDDAVPEVHGIQRAGAVALLEPEAGWVDPSAVTALLLRQAVRDGARLITRARVTRVHRAGGTARLTTAAGEIRAARAVVLATGGWGALPPAGVRPSHIRTRAIQVSLLRRPPGTPEHATFLDLTAGCYAKPVDRHTSLIGLRLLVWDEPPGLPPAPDAEHHRRTVRAVGRHLAWVREAELVRLVRSFDGYGAADGLLHPTGLPGVWWARPGNGGGVRVAPRLGAVIAEQLLAEVPAPAGFPGPDD